MTSGAWKSPANRSLGNYTKRDICFGKYFKAINQYGKVVLNSVFLLLYQTLDTNGGTMPVWDYCLHKLNWSGVFYNKIFNSSERQILSKVPTSEEFVCDVSLLFKITNQVLGNLTEPIKKEIRDLKNLRNTVAHEDLQLDEPELANLIEELKTLCHIILEGTGSLLGQNLSNIISEVENGLQDLLMAKMENSDTEMYLETLENFRQEKQSKMISDGRKELMNVYSKTTVLNPCSWMSDHAFKDFTVENVFTSLKLAVSGREVPMNNILNTTSFKERFVPRMVIVRGVMGAGKTSLYRYLLQQWCTHSSAVVGLMNVDIVIAMEMRTVKCNSLVQFLREQLLKATSKLFSESDIIPVLQDLNVLFLIDGMDEATKQGKEVVREIVNKFTDSSIVVTTRPEFTLELMQMADDHVVLQLDGFTKENQRKYVEKIFAIRYPDQQRAQETKRFLRFKSGAYASLSNHLTLPLTLALLLILWCDDTFKVTTVTNASRLYSMIYEVCRSKLTTRLEAMGAEHGASLKPKVRRWQVELGQVAWHMMCEDVLNLSLNRANRLIDLCEKEGIDAIQTMSTFLNCTTEQTLAGTKYNFSFPHSSGQEFLAAFYICEQVTISGSFTPILSKASCSRLLELMMYVTGLLKQSNLLTPSLASDIKNMMISKIENLSNDVEVWWRLLVEAESDPAMCKVVGDVINQTDRWAINSWDSPVLTKVKANLLQKTGAAPSLVIIHVQYTMMLEDCSELHDILQLVAQEGKSKVKLYLDRHFNSSKDQEEEVEALVAKMLCSNRLVEFKGYFGYHSAMQLERATRTEALYVRVTSVGTLAQLRLSLRKHRRWKTKLWSSRKWNLKSLELFLDIDSNINPEDFPYLHYHKRLVVKLAGLSDNRAKWVGEVLRRLSNHYTSIILQESYVSLKGVKVLLDTASHVSLKEMLVITDQPATTEEVQTLAEKSGVNIRWLV
ncbi:hypothetical protein Pmani_032853 [Petrolisthes manimaculis]|uniref:NACHT domain-containing protein n=1 Tax=Petrolisthes manimaculis TaxID=1843537 RepID=A0AAE1NT02_9EUCA|nr:hypothetical protein Pmani_032853 [Petrolisthes manimaculis]